MCPQDPDNIKNSESDDDEEGDKPTVARRLNRGRRGPRGERRGSGVAHNVANTNEDNEDPNNQMEGNVSRGEGRGYRGERGSRRGLQNYQPANIVEQENFNEQAGAGLYQNYNVANTNDDTNNQIQGNVSRRGGRGYRGERGSRRGGYENPQNYQSTNIVEPKNFNEQAGSGSYQDYQPANVIQQESNFNSQKMNPIQQQYSSELAMGLGFQGGMPNFGYAGMPNVGNVYEGSISSSSYGGRGNRGSYRGKDEGSISNSYRGRGNRGRGDNEYAGRGISRGRGNQYEYVARNDVSEIEGYGSNRGGDQRDREYSGRGQGYDDFNRRYRGRGRGNESQGYRDDNEYGGRRGGGRGQGRGRGNENRIEQPNQQFYENREDISMKSSESQQGYRGGYDNRGGRGYVKSVGGYQQSENLSVKSETFLSERGGYRGNRRGSRFKNKPLRKGDKKKIKDKNEKKDYNDKIFDIMKKLYEKTKSEDFPEDLFIERLGAAGKILEEEKKEENPMNLLPQFDPNVSIDKSSSDSDNDDPASKVSAISQVSLISTVETNELLFENDLCLNNIMLAKMIFIEKSQGFFRRKMKGDYKNVKIIRRDNAYYFKGDDIEKSQVKENFNNFIQNLKVTKLFKNTYQNPKLHMWAFITCKPFNEELKRLREHLNKSQIYFEYQVSQDYYKEYRFLSKFSRIMQAKLKAKKENIGFLKIYIYSTIPNNIKWIEQADEMIKKALTNVFLNQVVFFFQIKLYHGECDKDLRREIIAYANNQKLTLNLIQSRGLGKVFYLDALIVAKSEFKSFEKKYDFKKDNSLKTFCFVLNDIYKDEYDLKDMKNMLIYQYFLQEDMEVKGKTMGIDINFDDKNFMIKFSNKCILHREIDHLLNKFDSDYFTSSELQIKTLDMPKNISEITKITIFTEMENIFKKDLRSDFGNRILKKFNNISQSILGLKSKVIFQDKPFDLTKNNGIIFKLMIFNKKMDENKAKTKESNERTMKLVKETKEKILIKLKKIIDKIVFAAIPVDESIKIHESNMFEEFNTCIFRVFALKNHIFCIGKVKSIIAIQRAIELVIVENTSKPTMIPNPIKPNQFKRVIVSIKNLNSNMKKKLKKSLKEVGIIQEIDLLEIKGELLIIQTLSNPIELKKIIEQYIDTFQQQNLEIIPMNNLYPNQVEQLSRNIKFIKELEMNNDVQIKINLTNIKSCHFELVFDQKVIRLLNNRIEDVFVDAIVNPQSEILLNSESLSEGANKDILKKAGKRYQDELKEFISVNKSLSASKIFTTSSGDIKTCKNIMNISVPHYDIKNWELLLADSFENIIKESEKQEFKSIALPLIGTGVFGLPLDYVFKSFLRIMQTKFYLTKLSFLREIYLCEIDQLKIKTIKDIIADCKNNNKIEERQQKYIWKWKNDAGVFEEYDNSVNKNIDEAYEAYLTQQNNGIIEIYLNISRVPGTHRFDFSQKTVTDLSTGAKSKLKKNSSGDWYHDDEMYPNQISEIINIQQIRNVVSFELFLKSYFLDFSKMKQFNQQTQYERVVEKTLKISDNSMMKSNNETVLIKYDKANIYKEERIIYPKACSIDIIGFSLNSKAKNVEKEIENTLKENFEVYKKKMPTYLHSKRIESLLNLCSRESIYLSEELEPDRNILIVGDKESLEKFEKELQKDDYPWDNMTSDFDIIDLKAGEPEYDFVWGKFRSTMINKKIISIKRIQNNELYLLYQQTLLKAKRDKKKEGQIFTDQNFEEYEKFLWHGTGKTDPNVLVDLTKQCLSTQYANDSCLWGRGIYFAENASYSHNYSYSKNSPGRQTNIFLYCKVFVGEHVELKPDKNLREPPIRSEKGKIRFDSVKGDAAGSVIYVVYGNNQSYPYYMVEYE